MADVSILRKNLSRLNTGNPFDTYNRQRAYMNSVLDREGRSDLQQRQNILRYFNLHDEAKPPETSFDDTTTGSISRAIDVGLEGGKQILEGGRARLGSMLGDGEMVEDARKSIQASQLEASKISALQDRLNPDSKLGRFLFDATSSLPVTGAALLGSGVAAATLTTIGIPKLIAGFIGYGVVDAMLESNANFGDVLTHPRMMASLKKILGRDPTDADLRNINEGVGKIMVDKAGQSANRTALANLFNPTNILESRMKILGGKGFAGRLGRRAAVEGVEEGGQSVTSQFFREQAIGEVDPTQRRPVDKGQALYEGALGTVSGTVISAPQTYLGLRADQRQERAMQDLTDEMNAQLQLEKDLKQRTTEFIATKDLQGVDEMLLGNEDQAQRDIILGTVQELKGSEDAGIAANARSYNRGTHIQKQEVAGDGQKEASTNDMDWQFREEYNEAKEAEALGTATPRQEFIIRYAKNVKNPELNKFLKSWGIHQRNMKDKNQPNQKMDTGQATGQQQQTQPQQQDQAPQQQEQQPATSEQIQAATDEIQQSLQQPATPQNQVQQETPAPIIPEEEADSTTAEKEIRQFIFVVLGDTVDKKAINKSKIVPDVLKNSTASRESQRLSRGTDGTKRVQDKFYDGSAKKQAAIASVGRLVDQDLITPDQGAQVINALQSGVIQSAPQQTTAPVTPRPQAPQVLTEEAQDLIATVDQGGMPTSINNNMRRIAEENGVEVLSSDTPADLVQKLRDVDEASLAQDREEQMTQDEPPVQPQADPIGKTITEQDARSQIRGVLEDTKSSSLLVPSIRKHVIDLMREDPTIDDQALLNSQMIDSQLDLFNANLINEYLSALKEIEGVDTNSIPEKYVNKYNIRKVLNKVFQSAGSAQSLRPTKLLNLGTAEESQARREFYKGMLTDPDFKGPDALDKSQLDKLEGGRAATDDKGMAFIDQSTEKVILQGGTIPEGTVIRVTTAGSKDRMGKMYRWTGRKPKQGDREPGMWYLAEFDGKDYRPVLDKDKLRTGETFAKDDDPFVRDDLWKETIRVNPDNKRGENITAAYLQLRDNPDRLTVSQGKTVYQLPDRGPGAEMPDPFGVGSVSGKLSDADKAMQDRIRDNNKTVSQFIQAQEAVNNNNTEKLSDLERANDELFEQNGFDIDSSFSDEGLTFVVSPEMNADPNFGALIKRLGFQELNRQPVGGAGDNIVTYGPPKPLRMPKFERDTTPQPREGGMPGEDPLNQGGYGQKMNKYSSLLKKRGSGKRTEGDDLQKAVDAMPDWLKNMIETNPKIAFLKKQEMIDLITTKTEKGNPAKDLTLPDSLMPKDTDTDRVVDAKRKIMDAIWEASSTEYATTNKGPGVRYSNLPKLWMVMSVLQNPGLASASIQKFLEFESASNMKNMSVEEMEIELMNLETMIDTQLPDMRESLQDAVMQEMLTTEELASIEAEYDSIMSDYTNSRQALENRAGELTPEEFAKQSEALRVKFVEDATKALDTLDTSGATQAVKDSKTRVEELTREIAGLNNKFDTLSTQYEDAIQQAKENATQGIYAQKDEEAAPEAAPVQESDERYAGIPIVDQDQIKNANAQTVSNAANILNRQIRTRMKASGVKDANLTKDKDIKVWFEEWLDANPSKILGKRKWRGEDKLYVANMTNNAGDVSQWVIDLSGQWIEQNGTIPIEAGKQRGEVGFDVTDILGKDYKNPRQETGVNEFSDATIQTDQLGGQYNLSEGELGKLADQLKQTELWSTAPEGVSVDNIVNSSDLDWKSPDADADPRTLPNNHALKFFYDALQKSLVPKGQLKAKATKMYNDMKDISYDYLKGLASYGYNSDTAVEEARNALSTGLINQSQYGAIDSIAVRNDKNMGKKKL